MKRFGSQSGAPVSLSLILALVYPAMIGAALALAYYGYKHAEAVSRPIEDLFREESRLAAAELVASMESRLEKQAQVLFQRLAAEKSEPSLASPCEVDPGPAFDSFVILTTVKKVQCYHPAESPAVVRHWAPYIRSLTWDSVKLDTFHYFHELLENGSVLIAYTARKTPDDIKYHVAARLNMDVVVKRWLDEDLARLRKNKNRRVAVLDKENGSVSGAAIADPAVAPAERFLHEEENFGKALYRWKIQIAPQNVEAFQADARRQKVTGPLLIIFSTVIIAAGLAIVWLVVLAERRASRLKSDFIANVSHELKTPLSLIRMFGELIATGRHKGDEAAREYGGIITRESERLSHLIDNVLDFARLERGKASYDFAEGSLAEVVERALDVCRYRLEKERFKVRTEIEPDLPPARMDENAMTLAILNLVDNAIKYAAEGRRVDVSVGRSPGGVVLSVRDDGPGIAADEQARVFERFYRAKSARDRNVRGSGIGLALVKHIAEAHGGRVVVESPAPGERGRHAGAVFRVYLPAPVPEGAESGATHEIAAGSAAGAVKP